MRGPSEDRPITANAGSKAKAYLAAAHAISCGARQTSLANGKILFPAKRKSTWLRAKPFRKKVRRTKRKTALTSANQRTGSCARRKSSRQPASQREAQSAPTIFERPNWKKNKPRISQTTTKSAAVIARRRVRRNGRTNNA